MNPDFSSAGTEWVYIAGTHFSIILAICGKMEGLTLILHVLDNYVIQ
jgi:hypothetical protein